ncbi:MAG TPA: hypothetical protein VHY20_12465, partial [Pirellulales bacterium]|nr:hypothetical protein [Pirellulales bacterium]
MAVRIYSLAKELKLEAKALVDLCTKAGITGKGSALASLTDEEVVKVKAFVAGGSRPVTREASAAPKASPAAVAAPPAEPGTFRREDYIAPAGGVAGKPPLLAPKPMVTMSEGKSSADAPRRPLESRVSAKSGPAIRVAPLPSVQQPSAPSKPAEPEPQKPDIKLPADAIRAGRAGANPLQAHLKKHEAKRKAEAGGAPPPRPKPGGPARPAPAPPMGVPEGKERRRGKTSAAPAEEDRTLGGREQRQLNRRRGTTELRPATIGAPEEDRTPRPVKSRIRMRR